VAVLLETRSTGEFKNFLNFEENFRNGELSLLCPGVAARCRRGRGMGGQDGLRADADAGGGGGDSRARTAAGRVARRGGPAPALTPFPVPGRSNKHTRAQITVRASAGGRAAGGSLSHGRVA
jgi:hypothetical protein